MKCLQGQDGRPAKVSNTVAEQLVNEQGYRYISREHYQQLLIQGNGTKDKSVEEIKHEY